MCCVGVAAIIGGVDGVVVVVIGVREIVRPLQPNHP